MRFAVHGTGAVGGIFGAQLVRGGHEVAMVARGAHLDAIRQHGLRIEADASSYLVRPALATDDPAQVGAVDVVLLGLKTWQVAGAARDIAPMIGPQTQVLTLQNGVEAPWHLASVLGDGHVLGGLCHTLSWVSAPGVIRNIERFNLIRFGTLDGSPRPQADALLAALAGAGIGADLSGDITAALWEKFMIVVPWGALGAACRAPIGVLRSQPGTAHLHRAILNEIDAVARARGVRLAPEVIESTMQKIDTLDGTATTSLSRDICAGRPSELEEWIGAVVRLGAQAGVPVPVSEVLYHCLALQEARARGDLDHAIPG